MLLLIVSEQWRGIFSLGDHFSAVARGRELYVILLLCVGSVYVVLYFIVLVCGRQSLLPLFYRMIVFLS